ncbi:hypothetical protein AYI69_g1744 [Smittium culicis]|uniref:DUF4139 domain-containing protein n=1 Tax=Smittium culicis TaxID=133412 RepID=A0A1R1YPE3_9FUNG|nr:hypothetical protein AYI69_g1744 [Smittium culicis]
MRTIETENHEELVLEIPDYNKINIQKGNFNNLDTGSSGGCHDDDIDGGSNQAFTLGENNTILPNNKNHRIEVDFVEFDSELMFTAFPQALGTIFLRAIAKNTSMLTFISGTFQVYVNDEYVATGILPRIKPGGVFDINLGPDKSIQMAAPEPNINTRTTWLLKSYKIKDYSYPLIFKNLTASDSVITIQFTAPKSSDDWIEVTTKLVSLNETSYINKIVGLGSIEMDIEKYLDNTHIDGINKWIITLLPKEQKSMTLLMTIKYPSDMKVIGM